MAAETSLVAGIAGRYATALFELARDQGVLDQVAGDLDRIAAAIDQSPEFSALTRSPLFSRDEQMKGVDAALARLGVSDLVRRFVGVVAHNRRAFALADMVRAFRARLAAHRGETIAEVVSASPLSQAQLDDLGRALAQSTKGEVRLNAKVDPELLGGLTVRLGSRLIDASLRTRLNNLKVAMKGVG